MMNYFSFFLESHKTLLFRGYAEVFATSSGSLVPVAWIGGLVNVTTDSNGNSYGMDLKHNTTKRIRNIDIFYQLFFHWTWTG